ncbi:MAG: PAS domain S-box protein [Betaproteobacteria bacterium]|nr:PAS domain S-box protein [Betaproteobacteria bacterium]
MRLNIISRTGLPIFAVAGLMALALWGAIAFALHRAELETLERADAEGRNIARSLAEHVASSVRAMDLVLLHLRAEWVEGVVPFADHVARQQENLKRENVSQVVVTDADGRVTYSSLPGFDGADVSDRPFFKIYKESGERRLQIGAPMHEPVLNQWVIKFTRPIHDRRGRFAGVLALFVPPPALERIYDDIELGDGSIIALVRADGQIVAHSRDLAKVSGVSLADAPGLSSDAAPSGGYRRTARTDGIERLYRYQKVPGYPLTIFVGQAADTVMAPYRTQRTDHLAAGVLTTVLLLAVALLLAYKRRDQQEAGRALQEQIAHLQLVYDTSSAAIFNVDTQGVITHANRRMAEMFALPLENLIGSAYPSHVHGDERETGRQAMFALRDGKMTTLDRERRYRRGDGSEFWGHITGRQIVDAGSNVTGLVGVIVDITDAKLAGEALRRNEARLRELFDAFPIAVAHVDKAQRMTFANRIYRDSYGNDYEGRPVREFAGERVYAVLEPIMRRVLAGEVVQYEHTFVGDDGQPATRALRYIPDRDASGEVTGFFALREDITARRRAEEQIRKLNRDLERRVDERTSELSAANAALQAEIKERRLAETAALSLAHRLRNMTRRLGEAQEVERRRLAAELHDGVCSNLAAIGLNLALLQKQLQHSDPASIESRLSGLIAQIDEAKANAKDISVDLRPLLLEDRDLFSALEEYARKFEGSTGIAVEVKGANSERLMPAEKKIALFRIAQEALTNCAKHARASSVAIEFDGDADHLRLSVADNGVGIDLAGINGKDLGLGLLSMQERAEAIGGRWQIDSAPGKGTRVIVSVGAARL